MNATIMTTEEKAKRYDEALEWMRELYPGLHGATKEDAEHYFPELAENEDETHRKWILEYLYDGLRKSDEQFKGQFKSAIAWLEKQKEQKPSIKIDQLKSLMLQYLQEASNEKEDSDIEADTDKWARKILGYDFEQKPLEYLSKEKVFAIINKLTSLSFCVPLSKCRRMKIWDTKHGYKGVEFKILEEQ